MNRRQEKFNNRHKLILEKAEEIIKKQGYINFTMDEVAKAVDIAKGTLYLHFKSKEELVYNLVHPKMLQLVNDVKKIVNKETDFILKLNRLISGLFSSSYFQFVVLSFPDMSAVFQKDTSSELELIQKEIIKNFISLINSGNENNLLNEDIPAEFSALQLMQLIDPLIYNQLVIRGDMRHEDFIRFTTGHFLNGILRKDEQ